MQHLLKCEPGGGGTQLAPETPLVRYSCYGKYFRNSVPTCGGVVGAAGRSAGWIKHEIVTRCVRGAPAQRPKADGG